MAISILLILIIGILPFIVILSVVSLLIYEQYNMVSGILVSILISFTGFIIYPGLFVIWYGDIYYSIGSLFGLVLTFKILKPDQPFTKTGIIVGVSGTTISSLFISIFEWVLYISINTFDINVLGIYILYFTPFAVIVGLIIGYLYVYYKKRQKEREESPSFFG